MSFLNRVDRYEIAVTVSSVVFVLSSSAIAIYGVMMSSNRDSDYKMLQLAEMRNCLDEHDCQDIRKCRTEIVRSCSKMPSLQLPRQKVEGGWYSNDSCKPYLSQVVAEVMSEEYEKVRADISSTEKQGMLQVKDAIQLKPSFLTHWYLLEQAKGNNDWITVTEYGKQKSTYTVARGPESASDGSAVAINEDGLYQIYAKITFSCTAADHKVKKVSMRVKIEFPGSEPQQILLASESAKCFLKGDLVTLYRSGHFSVKAGSRLFLEYSRPYGVTISRRHRAYKSYFGIYKTSHSLS